MFGLSSFSIIGLALVAAFGAGGTVAYRLTSLHFVHRIDEMQAKQRAEIDKANVNAEAAGELYESAKAKQYTRTVVITKEVSSALEVNQPWAVQLLPSELRDALARAADADPGQPQSAVPVDSATPDDKRTTGGGLRLGTERLPGLLGKASGSR